MCVCVCVCVCVYREEESTHKMGEMVSVCVYGGEGAMIFPIKNQMIITVLKSVILSDPFLVHTCI